jgi:Flp pilus assembly protein TadG
MTGILRHIRQTWRNFFSEEGGAIAIAFAFAVPGFLAAAGIAVDLAQAYNVKARLGNALDKAALAAGSMTGSNDSIQERAELFLEANYPADKIGTPYDIEIDITDDFITMSASSHVDTSFMALFGYEYINVSERVVVAREVRGLEVVMVLDNTGSMSTNNNIATLRTASNNFINILFDAASDPDDIKIGMVPYSSSVRVGRYGLGLTPGGAAYGTSFVTLPSGVSYTTNHSSSTGWYGCVVEHKSTNYNAAASHVTNSYGQLWRTATNCTTSSNCRGHGWDANVTTNDPYPNDLPDDFQGPWDIYMYGTVTRNCTGTCNPKYTFNRASQPNIYCPYANVMPMTSDRASLIANVATMQAEGATLSNVGMAWGYRVLSPDFPFEEGVEWDDQEWRKAILMMTDGETSMGGDYTSYWFTSRNTIDNDDLDDRMLEICTDLKERGVIIYTVTFAAGVPAATKEAYRECASSESLYFDAPSQASLIDAFEEIARQLAILHIVE